MPRPSVSQRLRGRLRRLLAHGDQVALARWSTERPGGTKISPQEISYFLNDKSGRRGLTLDDLDDIAAFFKVSIAELLGETRIGDLSGEEQRLIYAFRVLSPVRREQFLGLLEDASVGHRNKYVATPSEVRIKGPQPHAHESLRVAADTTIAPSSAEDARAELARLRQLLSRVVYDLSSAATGALPDEPLSSARAEKA